MLAVSAFAASSIGTAGCAVSEAVSEAGRVPSDVTVLRSVIAAKAAMIARYQAVTAAHPQLRPGLGPLLGDHRAHLAELQSRLVEPKRPAVPASASPSPASPSAPTTAPSSTGAAVAALVSAERAAAAQHAAELRPVAPSLAQLFGSIAACEATHVIALTAL